MCVWHVRGWGGGVVVVLGVCRNILKEPENFRQLISNGDVFDIETKEERLTVMSSLNVYTAQMTEHKLCVSLL